MNLSRGAISYGLGGASARTLLRLYVRIQLLWIIIWAASDLFLVWYWSGRLGGPGAHRYFGRWFLAWLFTQKLPLYFLSLPYRGQRCTIGSMYRYLNLRFYAGRSFAIGSPLTACGLLYRQASSRSRSSLCCSATPMILTTKGGGFEGSN